MQATLTILPHESPCQHISFQAEILGELAQFTFTPYQISDVFEHPLMQAVIVDLRQQELTDAEAIRTYLNGKTYLF